MRKLFTYLLRLTYNPYDEIPQPQPNETLDNYLLRSSHTTIDINIGSQKRTSHCITTWRNAQAQKVQKVFDEIYKKHAE